MNSRNQSPTELLEVQESFEKLIVDLNDGNQFLMFKCRKCDFISRNNMNSKHAHWLVMQFPLFYFYFDLLNFNHRFVLFFFVIGKGVRQNFRFVISVRMRVPVVALFFALCAVRN